ncbi:MAG: hypothetical protein CME19_08485 [Gemmatimonadetes bacterium]|nr:hypothetical protein [Gemmatimonadota bacterium]|tara:strand:+ start:125 stop:550 length:426 start_codon:yes stop_codon:yes gene_type:complete
MGGGMARNLLDVGYPVSVCDLDAKKVATLVDRGAASSPSPRETVANNDVTLFSQPTSGTFITVAEAEDGRLAGADDSKIVAATAYGGGDADKGTLAAMVGGDDDPVERVLPILQAIGNNVVHLGPSGAGQLRKAVNQIAMA